MNTLYDQAKELTCVLQRKGLFINERWGYVLCSGNTLMGHPLIVVIDLVKEIARFEVKVRCNDKLYTVVASLYYTGIPALEAAVNRVIECLISEIKKIKK